MKSKKAARKAMQSLSEVPTYHPLKRGRYKYNQSTKEEILKKGRVDSHRRALIYKMLRSSGLWKGKPEAPLAEVALQSGISKCPSCKKMNRSGPGTRNCDFCGFKYRAVEKRIENLKEALFNSMLDMSRCPFCSGRNNALVPGLVKCRNCDTPYRSISRRYVANIKNFIFGGIAADCPHCWSTNKDVKVNTDQNCQYCGREFYVTN